MGQSSGASKSVLRGPDGRSASANTAAASAGFTPGRSASAAKRERLPPLSDEQRDELAALRERAANLMAGLDRIAEGKCDEDKGDDRLLSKTRGVIDGFETLAQIVFRIIDKERDALGQQDANHFASIDEAAIDRRLADELDRLAARRTTAEAPAEDRAES